MWEVHYHHSLDAKYKLCACSVFTSYQIFSTWIRRGTTGTDTFAFSTVLSITGFSTAWTVPCASTLQHENTCDANVGRERRRRDVLYMLHHYCNLQCDFLIPALSCSGSVEIKGKSIRMGVSERQKESLIRTRIRIIFTWQVYLLWKQPPYQRRSPYPWGMIILQLVQREKVGQQISFMKQMVDK